MQKMYSVRCTDLMGQDMLCQNHADLIKAWDCLDACCHIIHLRSRSSITSGTLAK